MMNSGYKHFSHAHNLIMHQAHDAANMPCSGCNSLVNGTAYVCWQCNFVLHEQCFHAMRSLKHPSHPSHPLTLVPYPTYPSNSFYCNICKLTGTGLSYSCSDCEFDLHVLCAQSGTRQQMVSQNVYAPASGQIQNGNSNTPLQYAHMHGQHAGFVSAQSNAHNPNTNPLYSSTGPNMRVEESGSAISYYEQLKLKHDAEFEHVKMNMQRLEIAREESRLAAINRQRILDLI
ncbi:putative kinase C-like, phorbol ester/diacylglycerol-binding protein [Helianthus debilis subsp. tardiflorus]